MLRICRKGTALLKCWSLKCIKNSSRLYRNADDHASYLAQKAYWEGHYERAVTGNNSTFEWLLDYATLWNHLPTLAATDRLLDVGCGLSDLTLRLAQKYQCHVWCIDISQAALHKLQTLQCGTASVSNTSFIQADAENLPFLDCTFECIIDKGTVDSVLKHRDSRIAAYLAEGMIRECGRVLAPGGRYLQVTDEDPELRLPLLQASFSSWGTLFSLSYKLLTHHNREYFIYTISKCQEEN